MKQVMVTLTFVLMSLLGMSQDYFDSIFAKYSSQNNYVSISIGKELLSLAACFDESTDSKEAIEKLNDLRILVRSGESGVKASDATFMSDIQSYIDKNSYIKLMEVVDSNTKLNFYAKKKGKMITHLIMFGGEPNEEILLSIKGEFSTKDIVSLGKSGGGSDELSHLAKLKSLEKN